MAYVQRWITDFNNLGQGVTYTVKILEDGYAGSSSNINTLGKEPLIFKNRGKNEELIGSAIGAEISFNFIKKPEDGTAYDDLFIATERQFKVEVLKDAVLYFTGYLRPEGVKKSFIDRRDTITLTFTDMVGILKTEPYQSSTGSFYLDSSNILTVIKRCIEKTGLELDFNIKLGYNHFSGSLMAYDDCALDKAEIKGSRFYKINDGVLEPENCAEVLRLCLLPFNCTLRQLNGKWYIANLWEVSSRVFVFDWATLTEQSKAISSVNLVIDSYNLSGRGSATKRRPQNVLDITFQNKFVEDNLLTNGDFSSGTTGWANSVSPKNWNNLFQESGGELITVMSGTEQTKEFGSTQLISLTENSEEDRLTIEFRCRVASIPTGRSFPSVAVRIKNLTTLTSNYIWLGYASTTYQDFSTGPVIMQGDGNYAFDVVMFLDSPLSSGSLDMRWDDFSFWQDVAEGVEYTVDRIFRFKNTALVESLSKEHLIKFGDSDYDNDVGALKIGGTRTSEWRSYQGSEDLPLVDVMATQYLRARQDFYEYVTLRIKDPNDTISPEQNISFDSKNYRVISFTKKFKKAEVDLNLVEIKLGGITTSKDILFKNTVDGQGGGSTISGGAPTTSIDWGVVTNTPTTISGYGITDAFTQGDADALYEPIIATKNSAFNKNFAGSGIATTVARSDHNHTGVYEPVIPAQTYEPWIGTKGTAFNKNFGVAAGTVAEGNHNHSLESLTDTQPLMTVNANLGEVIYFDGTNWNRSQSAFKALTGGIWSYGYVRLGETAIVDLPQNQVGSGHLFIDSADQQLKFENWQGNVTNLLITTVGNLNDIGDVSLSGLAANQMFFYNGTNWANTGLAKIGGGGIQTGKVQALAGATHDIALDANGLVVSSAIFFRTTNGYEFLTDSQGTPESTLTIQKSDSVFQGSLKADLMGINGATATATVPLKVDLAVDTDYADLGSFLVKPITGGMNLQLGASASSMDITHYGFSHPTFPNRTIFDPKGPNYDTTPSYFYIKGANVWSGSTTDQKGGLLWLAGGNGLGSGDSDGGDVQIDGGAKVNSGIDGNVLLATARGQVQFGNGSKALPTIRFGDANTGFYSDFLNNDLWYSWNNNEHIGFRQNSFTVGTDSSGFVDLGESSTRYWRDLYFNPQTANTDLDADHLLLWNPTSRKVVYRNLTGTASSSTFLRGDGAWASVGSSVSQLADLSDVVSATNTNRFALMANGTTGYVGRAIVEADISDLQSYITGNQTITLGGDLGGSGSTFINATIQPDSVTYDMIQDISTANTVLGRFGSTGTITQVSTTTLTSNLLAFSTIGTAQGLVPGSNGATALFLRGDGVWAAPTVADNITGAIGDNQIAVGGATTDTIEGSSFFTWDRNLTQSATGVYPAFLIQPEIDQTGLAGYTAIRININQDTVGTGQKSFIKFDFEGVEQARIDTAGKAYFDALNLVNASTGTFSTSKILTISASGEIETIASAGTSTGRFLKDDGTFAVPAGTGLGGTVSTDEIGYGASTGILTSSPNFTWNDTELSLKVDGAAGLTSMLRLQKTRSGSAGATGDGLGIQLYLEDAQGDIENVANVYGYWQNTSGPFGGIKTEVYDSITGVAKEVFNIYLAGNPYYIFGNADSTSQLARIQPPNATSTLAIYAGGGASGSLLVSTLGNVANTNYNLMGVSADFNAQTGSVTGSVLVVDATASTRTSTSPLKIFDMRAEGVSKFHMEYDGDLFIADQPTAGNTSDRILMWDATGEIRSIAGSSYLTGISSGDVTTALGYTPYNSTNPSGYISGNQIITLSGDITGSGATSISTALASNTVNLAELNTTGTASTSTYLRGDMQWVTPPNTNYYASSFGWNTGTGVLTLNRSGLSAITIDLDGRYVTSSGVTSVSGTGSTSGLTLSGTVTTTGNLTLSGTVTSVSGLSLPSGNLNNQANKLVRTDGSGYVQFGWINTVSGSASSATPARIYCSQDAYIRYMTAANFVTYMYGTTSTKFARGDHSHSNYIRSNASDSVTSGTTTWNDNVKIGFGTSNAEATLYSTGTFLWLNMAADKDFYILDNGSTRFLFDSSAGAFHADNNITAYSSSVSDRRLKENIAYTSPKVALELILSLDSITYNNKYKYKDVLHSGYVAQDFEQYLPHLILETNVMNVGQDDTLFKTINYTEVIPYITAGIKEVVRRIDDQLFRIETNEEKIAKLETEVEKLKSQNHG
jgi:hypothetical protein